MAGKNTLMTHKGYFGSIAASIEDGCLYGKLEYIRPLISYEGQTLAELQAAFTGAVEDYLADCANEGVAPEKPCKGSFNVRIGQERHLQLAMYVGTQAKSINDLVIQAIDHELEKLRAV